MDSKVKHFIEAHNSDDLQIAREIGGEYTNNPYEADWFLFTGGADVSPELYGEKPHPSTSTSPGRDKFCKSIWKYDKPKIGICRGAQFMAVMLGGKLHQDIRWHAGPTHVAAGLDDSLPVFVNSFHHQGIRIGGNYKPVKVAECDLGTICEAVEGPKCFGVQFHPEWMPTTSDGYKFFIENARRIVGL